MDAHAIIAALLRWLHFFFGIMWIGLLYYFNFVQAQALAEANKEGIGQGISKYVLPRALFFFRWAAVGTWLMGAALLESLGPGGFMRAFTFQPLRSPQSASVRGWVPSC